MTPEKKVKKQCTDILKAEGVYFFLPATYGMGRSGIPDIICCAYGRFLAIECKAGKGVTTALQKRELRVIGESGGTAIVMREDSQELLKKVLKILKDKQVE